MGTMTGSPHHPPRVSPPSQDRWDRIVMGLGITVAVVLAIGGLAAVGVIALFAVGMSNYGSNK